MPNYIVNSNAQPNGDYEVHVTPQQHNSCSYPALANRVHLGLLRHLPRRSHGGQGPWLHYGQRLLLVRQRLPYGLSTSRPACSDSSSEIPEWTPISPSHRPWVCGG